MSRVRVLCLAALLLAAALAPLPLLALDPAPSSSTDPPPPPPADSDGPKPAMQAFVQWLISRGGDVDPALSVRDLGIGHGGRGIFANEYIPGGKRVMRVPLSTVLNVEHALTATTLAKYLASTYVDDINALALFLVHELTAPTSQWRPYLDVLPTTFTTPLYFSPDELELLKGSPAYGYILNREKALRRQFQLHLQAITASFPTTFETPDALTEERFKWALSVQWSRLLRSRARAGEQWYDVEMLVPLVDMVNTGYPDEINLVCRTESESLYVDCVTDRDIAPGTELLRTYQDKLGAGNMRMLLDFGFAFEQNLEDTLIFALPELTISNEILKMNLLAELHPDVQRSVKLETNQMKQITVSWGRPIPKMRGLMAYMRILHMSDTDHRQNKKKILELLDEDKPISVINEKIVVDVFIKLLNLRLSSYPTTLTEDEALLDELYKDDSDHDFHGTTHERNAVTLRYSEKLLLRHNIKQLQEHYMEVLNAATKAKRSGKEKKNKDKDDSDDDKDEEKDDDKKDKSKDGKGSYRTNPAWTKLASKDEV